MNTVSELHEFVSSLTSQDVDRISRADVVSREDRLNAFNEASRYVNYRDFQTSYADVYETIYNWPLAAKVAVDEALYAILATDKISRGSADVLMATLLVASQSFSEDR